MEKFVQELKEKKVVIANDEALNEVNGGNTSCLICINDIWKSLIQKFN
ncbi:hypothetical protein [Marinilactibacillus psychrotolerans]|uniref:Uncharacterized protein n=1 Tax=Marinilactibacillus psychrotolerans 42ea TaxID=1255609 RepID=A0A1R4K4M0_9LACT|nr:hypothetical protein [Marinilactibacillus psychrotolerans]SJN39178.1 hypothetical protein FM115_08125 [Marinilactibacillus psychrotolerans 42ea]